MQIILDELKRTLKYHQRQLEDNLNQINSKRDSISYLEESNIKHIEAIEEIEGFIREHEGSGPNASNERF